MDKKASTEYKRVYDEVYLSQKESENYLERDRPYYYSHLRRFKSICHEVANLRPKSVLDVGCGDGIYAIYFSSISIHYIGVDIALINLKRIKKRANEEKLDLDLILCDAQYLPLKNGYFDVVLCSEVIEHLLDVNAVVSEINRTTKNVALISTPVMGWPFFNKIFSHTIKIENQKISEQIHHYGIYNGLQNLKTETGSLHVRIYTISLLKDLFRENNLNIEKIIGAGFMIPFLPLKQTTIERFEDQFLNRMQLFLLPIIHVGHVSAIFLCSKNRINSPNVHL